MSLFIVETLHFNNYQRVVHEGVSSREAISKIFTINGVRIKITATMVFQLWKKLILMESCTIFPQKHITFLFTLFQNQPITPVEMSLEEGVMGMH